MRLDSVCVFVSVIVLVLYWFYVSKGGNTPPGPVGLPYVGYLPFLSSKPYVDFQRLANIYGPVFSVRLGTTFLVVLNEWESPLKNFLINDPFALAFNRTSETDDELLGDDKICLRNNISIQWKPGGKEKEDGSNIQIYCFMKYNKTENEFYIKVGRRCNNRKRKEENEKNKLLELNITHLNQKYLELKLTRIFFQMKNASRIWNHVHLHLMMNAKLYTNVNFNKNYLKSNQEADCAFSQRTLEWLLLMVAAQSKWQKRIFLEIRDKDWSLSSVKKSLELSKFPYTTAFILEMIRWKTFFPLSNTFRTSFDTLWHGYFIPKHTFTVMNIWSMYHRREKWGSDFSYFKPQRFLSKNNKTFLKLSDFASSLDSWTRLGSNSSFTGIFHALVKILQYFTVSAPDGRTLLLEEEFNFCLTPKEQEILLVRRN